MARVTVALRTQIASGADGSGPGVVVETADGVATMTGNGPRRTGDHRETAALAQIALPRARLDIRRGETIVESHDVVLLPIPDARRATTGVLRIEAVVDGWRFEVDLEPESRARLRERATKEPGERARGGPVELRAIIPGRVVSVDVVEGDVVEAGQRVLVVEAMKMQNELRAPRAGTIGRVAAVPGQTVELGDVMLVIE